MPTRHRLYFKIGVGAVAILGLVFLALPFLPLPDPPLAGWGAFAGRFHPLVVHFPIVLVAVPLLLELTARLVREEGILRLVPIVWGLAALSCIVAVVAGYLLYVSNEYAGDLIRRHLWAGVVLVIAVLWTAFLSCMPQIRASRHWFAAYLGLALFTNGVVVYAGHLGGSLTHGEDFLIDAFPGWGYQTAAVESRPREELRVLQDLVMPAFRDRCMSCHNPNQAKGELDMTSVTAIERGGASEKLMFVPHRPDSSELFRRITLPIDHDDRMPPEGRPSLTSDQVAILEWWIEEGADPEMRLGDGPPDLLRQTLIDRYLPRLVLAERRRMRERREVAALGRELERVADRLELVVEIDPETDSTLFGISMQFPPGDVDDRTIARLVPYAESVSKVSLVASNVTDDGLRYVGRMHNLRTLILQKTGVDGSGLVHLEGLPALDVVNLSHTTLTDDGALNLLRLSQVSEVYLYNTDVSDSTIAALRTHLPDVEILEIEGPYY